MFCQSPSPPFFFFPKIFGYLFWPSAGPSVSIACYFGRSSGPVDVNSNELMGDIGKVKGRDVVIVDELIDTGGTLGVLPRKLRDAGAGVSCYSRMH